ncbi:MAG: LacI family DNA-binding transcriptional regulator [Lancefieldella parvula]|uniref:LacI family DNA-binding transcriptional regulator n=1 Tax=Lancefieldella parvula TaxID=1382 RepID=A0A9E7DBE2_9ACTN|nr:MAG: LacI family DNA-binding transcriptional regulator [Lancefieldella parvula]
MTRVSIRDVAAETGYSPATVSNVLNEKGNVGAKATHIILEAIVRLGYSRSAQISRIIFAIARVNGRIVDESAFQAGVYTGIERAARRLGLPSAMVTLGPPRPCYQQKKHCRAGTKRGSWRRSSRHRDCLRRSVFLAGGIQPAAGDSGQLERQAAV